MPATFFYSTGGIFKYIWAVNTILVALFVLVSCESEQYHDARDPAVAPIEADANSCRVPPSTASLPLNENNTEPKSNPKEDSQDRPQSLGSLKLIDVELYQNMLGDLFGRDAIKKVDSQLKALHASKGATVQDLKLFFEIASSLGAYIDTTSVLPPKFQGCNDRSTTDCLNNAASMMTSSLMRLSDGHQLIEDLMESSQSLTKTHNTSALSNLVALILQNPAVIYPTFYSDNLPPSSIESSPEMAATPSDSHTLPAQPSQGVTKDVDTHQWIFEVSEIVIKSAPPEWLVLAESQGELSTVEGRLDALKRLLSHERGKARLADFYLSWLGFDESGSDDFSKDFLNGFDATDFRKKAREDFELFALSVTFDAKSTFRDLLTSRFHHPHSPLKDFYQSQGASLRDELDEAQRSGLLTRSAFLIGTHNHPSAIIRGVTLLKNIMCQSLPPPPDNFAFPKLDDNNRAQLSTRALTDQITSSNACVGCHAKINATGFLLGNYDSLGRFQDHERVFGIEGQFLASHAIDARGLFDDQSLEGAIELSIALSENPKVLHCFAQKLRDFFRKPNMQLKAPTNGCTPSKDANSLDPDKNLLTLIAEVLLD